MSGIRKVVVAPNESPNSANPSVNPDIPQAPEVITTNEESENYRQEYDNLVRDWRAESAVNRRKAGEERNRWEAIRASEREESQRTGKKTIRDSWEQLDDSQIAGPPNHRFPDSLASPSPADVRDKVSGESEGGTGRGILQVFTYLCNSFVIAWIKPLNLILYLIECFATSTRRCFY